LQKDTKGKEIAIDSLKVEIPFQQKVALPILGRDIK
jgi:hypothetical protein